MRVGVGEDVIVGVSVEMGVGVGEDVIGGVGMEVRVGVGEDVMVGVGEEVSVGVGEVVGTVVSGGAITVTYPERLIVLATLRF